MPSHAHSASSDSTARSVHFAQDAQLEGSYGATDVYPRRVSPSLHTTTQIPSLSSPDIRMTQGHSRNMSGSSVESTSSTQSFFPTLPDSRYSSHTASHRYNNSGSSMSSFEFPVLEKQKTVDLPPSDESPVDNGWVTRGSDYADLQVEEQLQVMTICPKMTIPSFTPKMPPLPATKPINVTSMLVSVEGLEAFDPVSIEATGTCLTAEEVAEGIRDFLEAPITIQERIRLHEQKKTSTQLASGIRRYELLSEQGVKVAFQGFTFDATRNEWVLHRYHSLVE